jgi:hypothetical protein
MIMKGYHNRQAAPLSGQLHRPGHDGLMAAVDAVKVANRHRCRFLSPAKFLTGLQYCFPDLHDSLTHSFN